VKDAFFWIALFGRALAQFREKPEHANAPIILLLAVLASGVFTGCSICFEISSLT